MAKVKITLNDGSTKIVQLDDNFTDADIDEVTNSLNSSLDLQGQGTEAKPFQVGVSKNIDLRPSGLANTAADYVIGAPLAGIEAIATKKPFGEVFNKRREQIRQLENEIPAIKRGNELADITSAFALPQANLIKAGKFAQLGNNAITGAYQGGLIGGAESLANEGDLSGVVGGAGTGSVVNIALPPAIQQTAKGIEKVINNPMFRKGTANTLEALTSVPSKYSDIALENELAGNTIFGGKFNPETAYIPIERKLREAKGLLPTKANFAESYKRLGNQVRNKLFNETMPESWYDEQYRNLGSAITNKMQSAIKPDVHFDQRFNELGKSVLNSIDDLKNIAGSEIDVVVNKMSNKTLDIRGLKKSVDNIIKNAARGGEFNPAELKAAKDLAPVLQLLENPKTKAVNLHNAKEFLYDTANYEAAGGIRNTVLKNVANEINTFLRKNPAYAATNDKYSNVMNVIKGIGGNDSRTIATKLKDYGSGASVRSGADSAFRELETLLPFENRFMNRLNNIQGEIAGQKFLQDNIRQGTLNNITKYDNLYPNEQEMLKYLAPDEVARYQNLSLRQGVESNLKSQLSEPILNDISKYNKAPYEVQNTLEQFAPKQVAAFKKLQNEENAINELLNTVGKQYEKNPRLLSNRSDEAFEQALDDLQKKTGVNFMDDLNKTRAREALENIFPGQGGGSGSSQGFGNLVRTSIIGGTPTAALLTHNPLALAGLGAVSPKFMAQGTIKNLGRLNNAAKDLQQNIKTNVVPYIYGLKKMFDRD